MDEHQTPSAVWVAGILPSGWTMLPLEELANEYLMRFEYLERETGILPFARRPGDTWYGWYVDGGLTWVDARDPRLVRDAVVLDGPR